MLDKFRLIAALGKENYLLGSFLLCFCQNGRNKRRDLSVITNDSEPLIETVCINLGRSFSALSSFISSVTPICRPAPFHDKREMILTASINARISMYSFA